MAQPPDNTPLGLWLSTRVVEVGDIVLSLVDHPNRLRCNNTVYNSSQWPRLARALGAGSTFTTPNMADPATGVHYYIQAA